MTRSIPQAAVFGAGVLALAWVAASYWPGQPWALALLLPIAAAYLFGAFELQRFRQGTAGLVKALQTPPTAPTTPAIAFVTNSASSQVDAGAFAAAAVSAAAVSAAPVPPLVGWLATLQPSLRNPVRLRVEGERAALPGPALTPYLVGLLVLLGMLGTFLGMVATLKGTGLALENASDVDAIRASLAAPVKGLGLAFGASVAGVATSAMLGLMSAMARRERQQAGQQLDALCATHLQGFSRAHQAAQQTAQQREQALLLQHEHLALQREQAALLREQAALLRDQAALQPALVAQWQGLAAQMGAQAQLQQEHLLASQAEFQLEAQRAYQGLGESVGQSLQSSLNEGARLASATLAPALQSALAGMARETGTLRETLGAAVQSQLDHMAAQWGAHSAHMAQQWQAALAEQHGHNQALGQALHSSLGQFNQTFEQRSNHLLDGVAQRLARSESTTTESWRQVLAQQGQSHQDLVKHTQAALLGSTAAFEQQASALLRNVAEAQSAAQIEAAAREQAQQQTLHTSLAALHSRLQQEASEGARALIERQQLICSALERSAQEINAQAAVHAQATLAQIAQLVQASAEAPRAAASTLVDMRQALSESLARDNAQWVERQQLMAALGAWAASAQQAGAEQGATVHALVQASSDMLDRVGARFASTVQTQSEALHAVAAQVTGSAAEVASLGEGFGAGVQLFSSASEQLTLQLQRIESALNHSSARSDEQLAYYVAQAREIVDLTLGAQKQVVDELQSLARADQPPRALAP